MRELQSFLPQLLFLLFGLEFAFLLKSLLFQLLAIKLFFFPSSFLLSHSHLPLSFLSFPFNPLLFSFFVLHSIFFLQLFLSWLHLIFFQLCVFLSLLKWQQFLLDRQALILFSLNLLSSRLDLLPDCLLLFVQGTKHLVLQHHFIVVWSYFCIALFAADNWQQQWSPLAQSRGLDGRSCFNRHSAVFLLKRIFGHNLVLVLLTCSLALLDLSFDLDVFSSYLPDFSLQLLLLLLQTSLHTRIVLTNFVVKLGSFF